MNFTIFYPHVWKLCQLSQFFGQTVSFERQGPLPMMALFTSTHGGVEGNAVAAIGLPTRKQPKCPAPIAASCTSAEGRIEVELVGRQAALLHGLQPVQLSATASS